MPCVSCGRVGQVRLAHASRRKAQLAPAALLPSTMADKIAGGSWHEGPPAGGPAGSPAVDADAAKRAEEDRLTARRDSARWTAVVGFGMMFLASFSVAFATGGVVMVLFGVGGSLYWSRRLRRLKGDPWAYDPELDGPEADWRRP